MAFWPAEGMSDNVHTGLAWRADDRDRGEPRRFLDGTASVSGCPGLVAWGRAAERCLEQWWLATPAVTRNGCGQLCPGAVRAGVQRLKEE